MFPSVVSSRELNDISFGLSFLYFFVITVLFNHYALSNVQYLPWCIIVMHFVFVVYFC